jgi:hypothetical protein
MQTATFVTRAPQHLGVFLISNNPEPGYTLPPSAPAQPANSTPPPQLMSRVMSQVTPASSQQTPSADACSTEKSVSTAWSSANGVVLNYVKALGNLAGVDAVPSPNPSPLVAGLAAAGVSSAETQAVSGLISSIASYFENQARDREIKSFLEAVNPNMPAAIGALERVDYDYATHLQNEYTSTVAKYDTYVRLEIGSGTTSGRAARRLLHTKSTVAAYLASVNQKLRASVDYGAAVETILKTHEQLYDASQRSASFADYLKIVQTTGEPVITNLIDLAKAVK